MERNQAQKFSKTPVQNTSSKSPISGSCACGKIKWLSTSLPTRASFCHCTVCQKISGGSFIAFMDLPLDAVSFTTSSAEGRRDDEAVLKLMSVSKNAERGFCGGCGSTLTMRYFATPEVIYLTLGSVDGDEKGALERLEKKHLYVRELGGWDKLPDDGWPRWDTMPNERKYLGSKTGSGEAQG